MIAFGHTAVGAAVGLQVYHLSSSSEPVLGLILAGSSGMLSHYIMDIIPHGHFFVDRKYNYFRNTALTLLFDLLLGVIIFGGIPFLDGGPSLIFWYIMFGIGGAQLPDILDNLIHLKILPRWGLLKLENHYHQETHWHGKHENGLLMSKWDLWQLSTIIASAWWVASSIS